jgi:hypothetical protein
MSGFSLTQTNSGCCDCCGQINCIKKDIREIKTQIYNIINTPPTPQTPVNIFNSDGTLINTTGGVRFVHLDGNAIAFMQDAEAMFSFSKDFFGVYTTNSGGNALPRFDVDGSIDVAKFRILNANVFFADGVLPDSSGVYDIVVWNNTSRLLEKLAIGDLVIDSDNFATANLTATGNRTHAFEGFSLDISGASSISFAATGDIFFSSGGELTLSAPLIYLYTTNGVVLVPNLPEYADNATAVAAGLSIGRLYRTGDTLKVVH